MTERKRNPLSPCRAAVCIFAAAEQLQAWRLQDATLYCTIEPCPMCAESICKPGCAGLCMVHGSQGWVLMAAGWHFFLRTTAAAYKVNCQLLKRIQMIALSVESCQQVCTASYTMAHLDICSDIGSLVSYDRLTSDFCHILQCLICYIHDSAEITVAANYSGVGCDKGLGTLVRLVCSRL